MVGSITGLGAVAAALAVFGWVGLRARRPDAGLEDYMVARGSQGAGALGLSFLASGLGAWILFAPAEVGAFVGLAAVAGYALAAGAPFLVLALVGPRLRRFAPAGHSLTEFVRIRYGRVFHAYVVGVSILYMWVFLTAELTAVGAVTSILSGLDPGVAIIGVAAVTLAYTAYAGLRATLRTDRWQAVLLVVLVTVGAGAALLALPDLGQAFADSGRLTLDRVGVEAGITLVIAVTAANLFHQGYWQRVWAARDAAALRRGAVVGALASMPVMLLVGVLGIVAVGAGMDLGDPPAPFFALFDQAGAWLVVVVLILAVSLVASSVDTLENGLAALVIVERPTLSLLGARAVTVALMVPAVAVALQGYSVLRLLLVADLLAATAVVPALLGVWRRATPAAALAGSVAGLAGALAPGAWSTGSVTQSLWLATFPDALPTLGPFLGALTASAAVTVAVSLASSRRADLAAVNDQIPTLSDSSDQGTAT